MSSAILEQPAEPVAQASTATPVVAVKRRTIDTILVSVGVVATVAFAVAGGLLLWGHNFASNYVGDELASQHITFPSAQALTDGGRADLVKFADQKLDTGKEAEGYASFINGHLQEVAAGATYADLGAPESAAKADVKTAVDAGKPQATIDELQAKADAITGQRNTLFKGETLRGLLLSAYAWSTVGMIAGIAAIGAFLAAAMMAVLSVLGIIHSAGHPRPPESSAGRTKCPAARPGTFASRPRCTAGRSMYSSTNYLVEEGIDDRVPARRDFGCRHVPAARAAGPSGAATRAARARRPAADGAAGRRQAGDQPEHGAEGVPRSRARGPGSAPGRAWARSSSRRSPAPIPRRRRSSSRR